MGTPFDDQSNEPKVCDFYLAAFDFDPGEMVTFAHLVEVREAPNAATRC
ncbi:hypothetical protein [Streptomyces cupreus]|nr:hypothetical protein [Streptomyces cupreus]